MAMAINNNGSGNKVVWWLLGIFSTVILTFIMFAVNKVDRQGDMLHVLEVHVAGIEERLKSVEQISLITAKDQDTRTNRVNSLENRLNLTDSSVKYMSERYDTVSQRVIAFSGRVDALSTQLAQLLTQQKVTQ